MYKNKINVLVLSQLLTKEALYIDFLVQQSGEVKKDSGAKKQLSTKWINYFFDLFVWQKIVFVFYYQFDIRNLFVG